MAFVSAIKITEQVTGRKAGDKHGKGMSKSPIVFATDIGAKTTGGEPVYSLRVSIHPDLAKEARLLAGDRVDILFDREGRRGLIVRTQKNGWTLTRHNASKSSPQRLCVKMTLRPGLPSVEQSCDCAGVMTDEGILFDLPAECSFDENLRKKAEQLIASGR